MFIMKKRRKLGTQKDINLRIEIAMSKGHLVFNDWVNYNHHHMSHCSRFQWCLYKLLNNYFRSSDVSSFLQIVDLFHTVCTIGTWGKTYCLLFPQRKNVWHILHLICVRQTSHKTNSRVEYPRISNAAYCQMFIEYYVRLLRD